MHPEKFTGGGIESKENPVFDINIIVHRHGPKEGLAGPLSSEGESMTEEYFADAYEGITFDEAAGGADIEYSPVNRAQKTAEIYSDVVRKYGIGKVKSSRVDERLSEGSIAEHLELIDKYGGRGGKWLKGWMEAKERPLPDVKTGREAAADFSEWLLAKVSTRQKEGGKQEIDAFSHGPVMAAFLLKLEEKLGQEIFPKKWQEKNVFESSLNYLSYMNFHADSSRPDTLSLFFGDKKIEIPTSSLQELVRENQFMADVLQDASNETIRGWLSSENLATKNKRSFQGFEITDSIDGDANREREVSLVKILEGGQYPQRVHKDSDALLGIIAGSAVFESGDLKKEIKAGDKIKIPKGTPHGFELQEGNTLEFLSIQSPPIRNPDTGEENIQLTDFV